MSGEGKEELGEVRERRAARGGAPSLIGKRPLSLLCYQDKDIAEEGEGRRDRRARKPHDGRGLGDPSWKHKLWHQ